MTPMHADPEDPLPRPTLENPSRGLLVRSLAGLLTWPLLGLIRGYQLLISPMLGPRCRFYPSCSEYAREALTLHGPVRGLWLAVLRLVRCHPWGGHGHDPVPQRPQAQAAHAYAHARVKSGAGAHAEANAEAEARSGAGAGVEAKSATRPEARDFQ